MADTVRERFFRFFSFLAGLILPVLGVLFLNRGGGAGIGGFGCIAVGVWCLYYAFTDENGFRILIKTDAEKEARSRSRSSPSGSVYVLTNPELPDLVKIGYTTRSAEKRAKELSGTGVPGTYSVAHEIHVGRPKKVEKRVHRKLSSYRVRNGEFFKVSPEKAARTIKRVAARP